MYNDYKRNSTRITYVNRWSNPFFIANILGVNPELVSRSGFAPLVNRRFIQFSLPDKHMRWQNVKVYQSLLQREYYI